MNSNKNIEFLFDFIKRSKSPYHAVKLISDILIKSGFSELPDFSSELNKGGKYFYVSGASIFAFVNRGGVFRILSSHSDQPSFKVKCETRGNAYLKLSCEKYGGMIYHTWLDRPLAIAGRVIVKEDGGLVQRLVELDSRAVIPSVAIHLMRSQNDSLSLDPKCDLAPLFGLPNDATLNEIVANKLGISAEKILAHDLMLVSDEEPRLVGLDEGLILSPRLDDLASVCASLIAFIECANNNTEGITPVFCVFDNEEVGSETKDGAASTILRDLLDYIAGGSREFTKVAKHSLCVSADNAHAIHPNHPELSDPNFAPVMGGGVAIKHNANRRYATDAYSDAYLTDLCKERGITLQHYYNRPDIVGGSTLGSISSARAPIPTVDIGIPQLAMHSIAETCAVSDFLSLIELCRCVFS